MSSLSFSRSSLAQAVSAVRNHSQVLPEVALVLGSGLGAWADTVDDRVVVPYSQIPGMAQSGVAGHAGNLVLGTVNGRRIVTMQGRVHLYEGHSAHEVVFGLRLMLELGARTVIITNAAGGIASTLQVGDLMAIEDQLNLTGTSSLLGTNDDSVGPRFVDMTTPYDKELIALASSIASKQGFELRRGVYTGVLGPAYETPAEIRMYRSMGGDAVGMSTVLEVIAARHYGARVLGISCITNKAAGLGDEVLSHAEVQDVANRVRSRFVKLLDGILAELPAK